MSAASPRTGPERPVAVTIERVDKWFGNFQALKQIDLAVHKGERIVICGPSGSGKSTLIRCINRLEKHDSGRIVVNGIEVCDSARAVLDVRREVGMVFQQFNLFPHLTILENCMLAPRLALSLVRPKAEALAMRYLTRVRVAEQAGKYPAQLSGGQQQRVAVARALVGEPLILLADEPTGNLDSKNGDAVMELLQDIHRNGATICMVTHDPRYAHHADRTVHLFDGKIAATPEPVS